jgi:hypothetical protein
MKQRSIFGWLAAMCFAFAWQEVAADPRPATTIPDEYLMQPADLARSLAGSGPTVPLIFQVGFRTLFDQAHIRGAEYVGPASEAGGIKALRLRVAKLEKNSPIVLYCGCCPWDHCPNVGDAFALLRRMGFTAVKVVYIAKDFGTNWVDQGYPTSGS